MKVLKTELARQVLADPSAKQQLRTFIVERRSDAGAIIELRRDSKAPLRLRARVVAKAA